MPLVLLAAAGHPDLAVRERIACRLDAAIENGQPLYSAAEVLRRSPLRRTRGLYLEPAVCDTVVRVLRLVFRRRRKIARWRVRILDSEALFDEDTPDIVLTHHLKLLEHLTRRQRRAAGYRQAPCRVVTGLLGQRLRQADANQARLRARCRIDTGYCLDVSTPLPWRYPQALSRFSTLDSDRNLAQLGFSFGFQDGTLQLRPTTPEAILAFSAALARGSRLWLRDRDDPEADVGIVALRNFDEDEAEFPAVLCTGRPERWLQGLPDCSLPVAEEDRVAIARWLHLPNCWVSETLLEKLLT